MRFQKQSAALVMFREGHKNSRKINYLVKMTNIKGILVLDFAHLKIEGILDYALLNNR